MQAAASFEREDDNRLTWLLGDPIAETEPAPSVSVNQKALARIKLKVTSDSLFAEPINKVRIFETASPALAAMLSPISVGFWGRPIYWSRRKEK